MIKDIANTSVKIPHWSQGCPNTPETFEPSVNRSQIHRDLYKNISEASRIPPKDQRDLTDLCKNSAEISELSSKRFQRHQRSLQICSRGLRKRSRRECGLWKSSHDMHGHHCTTNLDLGWPRPVDNKNVLDLKPL